MPRLALLALLAFNLGLPFAASAATPTAPGTAGESHEAMASRCFGLQTSDPAAAIALAESSLTRVDLPVQAEIKLRVCLARAAAFAGDVERVDAAVARIDALLALNPVPPEFLIRALSNTGAALHMTDRIHKALDYYARAYEMATRDDSAAVQSSTLVNIAKIHSEELGAFSEAEAYYARAEAIDAAAGLGGELLPYNRALNFLRMDRDEEALAALLDGEARAAKAGNELVLQRIRAELATLRARPGKLAVAGPALRAAAAQQMALKDPSGAALTLVRLSFLELASGDANAALRDAVSAKEAVAGGVFQIEFRDALEAEVAAHLALEQWPQALAGSKALRRLEVDRLRSQQLAGLAGLQARLQDTRSAQALVALQQERQQQALRLESERRVRNGAIAAFFALALLAVAFVLYQRRVNRKLRLLSTVDSLTGLLNRRAGEASLREMPCNVAEGDRRCVAYLIDVDLFKDFNDRFGHAAGDGILSATAARLRAACRPGDIVARWGGEEFLVACHGLDQQHAAMMAERLRTAVHAATPELRDAAPLSVSIGFACMPFLPDALQPSGWQESVTLADRAMYAAKHSGRDTWVGLWGTPGRQAALDSVLADPEGHAKRGDLLVLAAFPTVQWSVSLNLLNDTLDMNTPLTQRGS